MTYKKKEQKDLTQAEVLLRASFQLMQKQSDTCYVLNILEQTTIWDGVECDGNCLLDEIGIYLDEMDVDAEHVPLCEEGV